MNMEWKTSDTPVPYEEAVARMESRVAQVAAGTAPGLVWLLEHPALYTAGTGARDEDLREAHFPVYRTGRGGKYTYHGPGQRVAYVVCDLDTLASPRDIRFYIETLERWIVGALEDVGVKGEVRPGRIGVWVAEKQGEAKIAAVGVRVRKWIAYHGVSINIDPDLSHYSGIVPCGLEGYSVTSVAKILGRPLPVSFLDESLRRKWGPA